MGRASSASCGTKEVAVKHRRFTVLEKLKMLAYVDKREKEGVSIRCASKEIDLDHSCVLQWRKDVQKLREESVPSKTRVDCRVKPGFDMRNIEKDLLLFATQERKLAHPVSPLRLAIAASSMCSKFRRRSRPAQLQAMRRFAIRHNLVIRKRSRLIAKCPEVLKNTCHQYLEYIRPILSGPNRHRDFIINMDETAVVFDMSPEYTYDKKGSKTITIRTTGGEKKRATVSITITASGKVLKPHIIYKGKPEGLISESELPRHPKGAVYSTQVNAWMDETVFYTWIDSVLVPHINTAPEGIEPLLIMDGCRVHKMKGVNERLSELGVRVELLPPGCTGLLQPVDVGINRTFKAVMRRQWDNWIQVTKFKKKASRFDMSKWILHAISKINTKICENSWKHREYCWFPDFDMTLETKDDYFWEQWIRDDMGGGGEVEGEDSKESHQDNDNESTSTKDHNEVEHEVITKI